MNARNAQSLIDKLNALPSQRQAEVEDFVDFLRSRERTRERTRDEAARRLGDAFARLDALNEPPMSPQDVQAEIDAARAARPPT